jgi:hypothetical protein
MTTKKVREDGGLKRKPRKGEELRNAWKDRLRSLILGGER